jgi:hypothetical protein
MLSSKVMSYYLQHFITWFTNIVYPYSISSFSLIRPLRSSSKPTFLPLKLMVQWKCIISKKEGLGFETLDYHFCYNLMQKEPHRPKTIMTIRNLTLCLSKAHVTLSYTIGPMCFMVHILQTTTQKLLTHTKNE